MAAITTTTTLKYDIELRRYIHEAINGLEDDQIVNVIHVLIHNDLHRQISQDINTIADKYTLGHNHCDDTTSALLQPLLTHLATALVSNQDVSLMRQQLHTQANHANRHMLEHMLTPLHHAYQQQQQQQHTATTATTNHDDGGDRWGQMIAADILSSVLEFIDINHVFHSLSAVNRWWFDVVYGAQHLTQVYNLHHMSSANQLAIVFTKWRRLQVLYCATDATDDMLMHLSESCHQLRTLDLRYCTRITDQGVAHLRHLATALRRLNLQGCRNISDLSLLQVLPCAPMLTHLNVNECTNVATVAVAQCLSAHNTHIQSLSVNASRHFNDMCLRHVGDGCVALQTLCADECWNISDTGVRYLTQCSQLRRLSLRQCYSVSTESIQHLSHQCTMLQEIYVSQCPLLNDAILSAPAASWQQLQTLDLEDCALITDAGLRELVAYASQLRVLNIARCTSVTGEGLQGVMHACPHLVHLNLSYCSGVNDGAIINLYTLRTTTSSTMQEVVPTTRAVELALRNCYHVTDRAFTVLCGSGSGSGGGVLFRLLNVAECPQVTLQTVSTLVSSPTVTTLHTLDLHGCVLGNSHHHNIGVLRACTSLASLTLSGCKRIVASHLHTLLRGCGGSLRHLDLSYCRELRDDCLIPIGTYCTQLESLSLSFCPLLHDDGVMHVLATTAVAQHLRRLYIEGCRYLTNKTIETIATSCSVLEELKCARLDAINDESVRVHLSRLACVATAGTLTHVDVSRCPHVSAACVQAFRDQHPHCRIIHGQGGQEL